MTELPDPIDVQFNLVHDCVRAGIYAEHIARNVQKKDVWLSIGDMCYAEAVISWNSIFGTNSQKSHWKGLVKMLPLPEKSSLRPFGTLMITEYLEITKSEWSEYHSTMVDARNNWFAHFDHGAPLKPLPDIEWALQSCYVYRSWLLALLEEYESQGAPVKIMKTTNVEMQKRFETEISEVCQ